jgi:transketolase
MVAANMSLGNLTVLFDNNRSQSRCLPIDNPEAKFSAFGFDVSSVDGHDTDAIARALKETSGRPRAIIANTTKGAGCPTLVTDMFAWHRRSPNPAELKTLLGELR